MTQYKLIKCYPGFTELGRTENTTWQGTFFYDKHPEFWQKVEEVDYEVLSFKGSISERLYLKQPNGKFVSVGVLHNYTFDECISKNLTFSIHSVKRLSDGEVFTIGDEIRLNDYGTMVIEKMRLTDSNLRIKQGVWFNYEGGSCHSSIPVKLKTPLFTTEDGVEIRIDDVYYAIEYDFKIVEYYLCSTPNGDKQFSTKEKAEEYVLLNKPMLSLQDLLSVWGVLGNIEDYKTSPLFHSFLELAKSKL